jgi:DNA-binding PadR family transcriptional regulator
VTGTDRIAGDLDDLVHQRIRLGVLTITLEAKRVDFGYLVSALTLSPGNLSRHLTVLAEAGLVMIRKGYEGRRPRTWVSITRNGSEALRSEVEALRQIVNRVDTAINPPQAVLTQRVARESIPHP